MPGKIDWENQIGRRLQFRDLHVFFTVVRQGSMAKAAMQLGVAAPTISEVIADLERAVGVRLLERGPKGAEPTLYGRAFLKRGMAAFDELKQGIRDIEFLSDPAAGEVRIGCDEFDRSGHTAADHRTVCARISRRGVERRRPRPAQSAERARTRIRPRAHAKPQARTRKATPSMISTWKFFSTIDWSWPPERGRDGRIVARSTLRISPTSRGY